jgi:hypothetical protein
LNFFIQIEDFIEEATVSNVKGIASAIGHLVLFFQYRKAAVFERRGQMRRLMSFKAAAKTYSKSWTRLRHEYDASLQVSCCPLAFAPLYTV